MPEHPSRDPRHHRPRAYRRLPAPEVDQPTSPPPLTAEEITGLVDNHVQAGGDWPSAAGAAVATMLAVRHTAATTQVATLSTQIDQWRLATREARAEAAEATAGLRHLRRAIRDKLLRELIDGALLDRHTEVDQALVEWGLPRLPRWHDVAFGVPFTCTVIAAAPWRAALAAVEELRNRLSVARDNLDPNSDLTVGVLNAEDVELDPAEEPTGHQPVPTPEPGPETGNGFQPRAWQATGWAPITVTVPAVDHKAAISAATAVLGRLIEAVPALRRTSRIQITQVTEGQLLRDPLTDED